MDIVFSLDETARASYLQAIMQSFHCTYICVWSYLPQPSNCLLNLDGLYRGDDEQPSSSSGSFDRRLFNEYRQLILNVENNLVPGHAFKNNISILELQESVLQTHASSQIQRQFYAAAGIKSSVFMGSSNGEIELGFSQVNMAEKMKLVAFPTWEVSSMEVQPADRSPFQNPPPTPSSSSLNSLSMESPESSSLFYNLPIASTTENDLSTMLLPPSHGRLIPWQQPKTPSFLAALHSSRPSSCSSSSSSSSESSKGSVFKKYAKALPSVEDHRRVSFRSQSMLKKWIVFYRNLNSMAIRERIQASRPASAQLLHMISERKRREKLNESFQALRSLLPPGTKKDKASVLATSREYLTKLKAQVSELSHKNQLLQAQVLQNREPKNKDEATSSSSSINEHFSVRVSHAPAESTSAGEAELVDLEITVRGEGSLMVEIAIRVLEFLKKVASVRVVLSFHADEQMAPSSSLTRLTFRFGVQGGEWDESAFLEAVRRIVSDLSPPIREKK